MYPSFQHGPRSLRFAAEFRKCVRDLWEHWDAIDIALNRSR